jgi:hypothetical protein
MKMRGLPASAAGVAHAYRPFLDVLIADEADAGQRAEIKRLARAVFTSIHMRTTDDAERLARRGDSCLTSLALVPVKSLDSGKVFALLEAQRAALIQPWSNIFNALRTARMRVLVVTGDRRVAGMAESRGFQP